MKTIASKIAPNPKEAQLWIDLTADPNGSVQKYWKGGKWVVPEKNNDNTKFNAEVLEVLTAMTNKIESLSKIIAEQGIEIETLKKANLNNLNRINKLEQFIVTE